MPQVSTRRTRFTSQMDTDLYECLKTTARQEGRPIGAVLEEAARAGHGKAAMFLAELYYQGFRVERDSLKAQYWQNMATMQA